MRILKCGIAAAVVMVLASCSNEQYASESSPVAMDVAASEPAMAARQMGAIAESAPAESAPAGGLAVMAASQPDRYLIKNATLIIETDDARAATDRVVAAMQQVQGYVSDLHETVNALGNRTVTMQVRIPSTAFDQSLMQVEALGKVLNKQVNTQDVTEEYVDIDARSRNLKSMETRLLDHLTRAGALEEVLRVEQELTRVREQIERLDGRLRFLSDRVGFSTIGLTLQEAPKAEPIMPAETFSTGKTTSEALRSLIEFAQGLWVIAIWVGVWSPVWLPLALAAAVVIRRQRRQRATM